ncbi:MAG: hypothetical protein KHY31_04475 [Clostridiales bacterium]|nr:hypothetical protein [Clostridiales bacterium]
MIFIDLFNNPPSPELIAEGKKLTKELMQLPPEQRNDFIDRHADYWGKLKEHYIKLSHGKCWYTETQDIASNYHMDHFRPKKQPKELKKNCGIETATSTEAYWWLAFDWKNYRLAAPVPNTSKHSYFPLKKGTKAIAQGQNIDTEWCGLLDPTDEYDVSLIAFETDGKVYPACTDMNCWDAQRVTLSKRVYNLNYPSLVDKRIELQQICKRKIQKIKNAQKHYAETHSAEFRDMLKDYVRELKAMTKPNAELSAVARNYIRNDPEEFIRNIAG